MASNPSSTPLCIPPNSRSNLTYDLHAHSIASDGEFSPERLVELAQRAGVDVLALTDHDTVAGIETAIGAAQDLSAEAETAINVLPGVEISSRWSGVDIHIVGLHIRYKDEKLLERLAKQAEKRFARASAIDRKLAKLGIEGVLEEVQAKVGAKVPGRPDFAKVLIERGICRNFDEVFRKYLGQGKAAYAMIEWPSVEETVAWITEAGGSAVLAHPARYKLTRTKLSRLIAAFQAAGGAAIEVATPGLDKGKIDQLANFAEEYRLMSSAGSDYHGSAMPWVQLGRYPPLPKRCTPIWSLWTTE